MGSDKDKKLTKKKKNGVQELLRAIIRAHGGASKIAKELTSARGVQTTRQLVVNWHVRGKVPLREIGVVSELLGVSPYALNYEEYAYQTGEYPSWESVIKGVKTVLPTVKAEIYRLPGPE